MSAGTAAAAPIPSTETAPRAPHGVLVCAIFFLSGAAALLFEHVWFRKAGLVFGNGVWASSLVLAGFMAGLALGNAIAARGAGRLRRPLLAYAAAEAVVGLAGVALVLALPALPAVLAPVLRPYLDAPHVLNALRFGLASALIAAVTTAMGTTLPLLAHALTSSPRAFGGVLGRLYGWNTLGASAGALAGEAVLYPLVGVRNSGLIAGGFSLLAAALATRLARRAPVLVPVRLAPAEPAPRLNAHTRRLLVAAASCGAIVLALEVVWWRFLQLFVTGSSRAFAVLLGVVLLGIALGGLLAGAVLARRPAACEWIPAVAFAAGWLVLASYVSFGDVHALVQRSGLVGEWQLVASLGGFLGLPLALLSGVLFTFTGTMLARAGLAPARATGLATLANTLGAMAGALAAGFLLLPGLGMERSFVALGLAYGVVALVAPSATRRRPPTAAAAVLFAVFAALFPFGLLARSYLLVPLARHMDQDSTLEAFREGLTETVAYVALRRGTALVEHRLITNNFNMSATGFLGRRYMKLYVYLPVALHPAPRRALLISYGVGSTAKALTDTRELERIDVVDISREVLDLSSVVYPEPGAHPLRDPRVRVRVEDGRYVLQTTTESYDLITGEPPPPKNAGVVNLYSREYFTLMRERLAPGGFATYWLPLHSLEPDDVRSIAAAFCSAFEDCTLWKGMGLSWMLVGTRGAREAVSAERFAAQWADPVVGPEMRALGLEAPEQLGALFVAGAEDLWKAVGGVPPLEDDYPYRLAPARPAELPRWYVPLGESTEARRRFATSRWVASLWPEPLRRSTLPYFELQRYYDQVMLWSATNTWEDLHAVVTGTQLQTLPLVMLGSDPDLQRAARELEARRIDSAFVREQRALGALARREFPAAAAEAEAALAQPSAPTRLRWLRAYALALAGRSREAREVLVGAPPPDPPTAAFFRRAFGI